MTRVPSARSSKPTATHKSPSTNNASSGSKPKCKASRKTTRKPLALISEYQQVNQQIQQATNQINNGYQQLLANQIADAYVTIHAATNEVSAQEGYTFVLSTRRGADLVQTSTLTGVTQEILARPLVTPPEAVDITDAVRIHMGLPTLEEITAQIEAEQAEAAAAAAEAQQLKAELDAANQAEETDPTPATEITDE